MKKFRKGSFNIDYDDKLVEELFGKLYYSMLKYFIMKGVIFYNFRKKVKYLNHILESRRKLIEVGGHYNIRKFYINYEKSVSKKYVIDRFEAHCLEKYISLKPLHDKSHTEGNLINFLMSVLFEHVSFMLAEGFTYKKFFNEYGILVLTWFNDDADLIASTTKIERMYDRLR